jgi:hypothetical protein
MTFEQTTGTRAQVWHGTAKKTSGGLTKSALMMNKHGRIVSRKKHNTAKKEKRLVKAGFLTKKGQFGFIKKGTRRSRSRKMRGGADDEEIMKDEIVEDGANGEIVEEDDYQFPFADSDDMDGGRRRRRRMMGGRRRRGSRSRKMRGGMAYGGPMSPSSFHGKGVGTSGVNLQFVAGSSG